MQNYMGKLRIPALVGLAFLASVGIKSFVTDRYEGINSSKSVQSEEKLNCTYSGIEHLFKSDQSDLLQQILDSASEKYWWCRADILKKRGWHKKSLDDLRSAAELYLNHQDYCDTEIGACDIAETLWMRPPEGIDKKKARILASEIFEKAESHLFALYSALAANDVQRARRLVDTYVPQYLERNAYVYPFIMTKAIKDEAKAQDIFKNGINFYRKKLVEKDLDGKTKKGIYDRMMDMARNNGDFGLEAELLIKQVSEGIFPDWTTDPGSGKTVKKLTGECYDTEFGLRYKCSLEDLALEHLEKAKIHGKNPEPFYRNHAMRNNKRGNAILNELKKLRTKNH